MLANGEAAGLPKSDHIAPLEVIPNDTVMYYRDTNENEKDKLRVRSLALAQDIILTAYLQLPELTLNGYPAGRDHDKQESFVGSRSRTYYGRSFMGDERAGLRGQFFL